MKGLTPMKVRVAGKLDGQQLSAVVEGYAWDGAPGLVLTPALTLDRTGPPEYRTPPRWRVTHAESGFSVSAKIEMTKRDAAAMLRALAPLTDWTRSVAIIRAEIDSDVPWVKAAKAVHARFAAKLGWVLTS